MSEPEKITRLVLEIEEVSATLADKTRELAKLLSMESIGYAEFNRFKSRVCAERAESK